MTKDRKLREEAIRTAEKNGHILKRFCGGKGGFIHSKCSRCPAWVHINLKTQKAFGPAILDHCR